MIILTKNEKTAVWKKLILDSCFWTEVTKDLFLEHKSKYNSNCKALSTGGQYKILLGLAVFLTLCLPLCKFPCITKWEFFRNVLAYTYASRLFGIPVVPYPFSS